MGARHHGGSRGIRALGGAVGLPDGDAMVVWLIGSTLEVHRVAADGTPVWRQPTVLPAGTSNFRLNAILPDDAGGICLFWDHPAGSYFRRIIAARVTADGAPAWEGTTRIVTPASPYASRHTPHAMMPDGAGGAWIAYTQGGQNIDTPRPVLLQRLAPDGTLGFDDASVKVSDSLLRQFEARTWRDPASGDVLVAWREGALSGQTVRVQRMTSGGTRLFGANGVHAATVGTTGQDLAECFDGRWNGRDLALSVSTVPAAPDGPALAMHLVAGNGAVTSPSVPLSGPDAARFVRTTPVGEAQVVLWAQALTPAETRIVAHLVQADGTLGLPPAIPGDVDGDGAVTLADLLGLLASWGPCPAEPDPCPADLDGNGAVEPGDMLIVLANWTA